MDSGLRWQRVWNAMHVTYRVLKPVMFLLKASIFVGLLAVAGFVVMLFHSAPT